VLVQDEALKRADGRIRELESRLGDDAAERPTGFLDGMRDALLGRRAGSVPSVRPGQAAPPPGGYSPGAPWQQQAPTGSGGSFLGTAAAAAAGVIGGSLLLDGIRSMMAPHYGAGTFGFADPAYGGPVETGSPWGRGGGDGDLAREAGLNDIGGAASGNRADSSSFGFFDNRGADDDAGQDAQDDADFGNDFGGDDGGGTSDA
jgi:hypothetical protein